MKLTPEEAQAARRRRQAFEANMAVEGLHIHPDDRAIMERLDDEGIGYEEGIEMLKEHLRKRGVIPAEQAKPDIAAE